mgnify:CR=1 FL=1
MMQMSARELTVPKLPLDSRATSDTMSYDASIPPAGAISSEKSRERRERVELPTTTLVAALDDCAKRFAQMDDLRRRAEARGSATRVVVYEDLAADRGRFDDLRAFLVEKLRRSRRGRTAKVGNSSSVERTEKSLLRRLTR